MANTPKPLRKTLKPSRRRGRAFDTEARIHNEEVWHIMSSDSARETLSRLAREGRSLPRAKGVIEYDPNAGYQELIEQLGGTRMAAQSVEDIDKEAD